MVGYYPFPQSQYAASCLPGAGVASRTSLDFCRPNSSGNGHGFSSFAQIYIYFLCLIFSWLSSSSLFISLTLLP